MEQDNLTNININVKKSFIFDNSNELDIDDRRELLQIIYNSKFRNTIKAKGGGVQIKLDELSNLIIYKLYLHILTRLSKQNTEFI